MKNLIIGLIVLSVWGCNKQQAGSSGGGNPTTGQGQLYDSAGNLLGNYATFNSDVILQLGDSSLIALNLTTGLNSYALGVTNAGLVAVNCMFATSNCSDTCVVAGAPGSGYVLATVSGGYLKTTGLETNQGAYTPVAQYQVVNTLNGPALECVAYSGSSFSSSFQITQSYTLPASFSYPVLAPLQER